MAKDFSARVVTPARAGGTTSGFANDFVHVPAAASNFQVTDKGGYSLVAVLVGTPPGSGPIIVKCGNDVVTEIVTTTGRSYPVNAYMYDKVTISLPDTTADVTCIISKNVGK